MEKNPESRLIELHRAEETPKTPATKPTALS
jgi:hypothetical protein